MSLLSPEELAKLRSAESLFASPIPVQSVSSDEFMPSPQTAKQREFEARVRRGRAHGEAARHEPAPVLPDRRRNGRGVRAMNDTYGPLFSVSRVEAATPEAADERAKKLAGQFIMDMHTHFLRPGTRIKTFINQRNAVARPDGTRRSGRRNRRSTISCSRTTSKEIYLDSDTRSPASAARPRSCRGLVPHQRNEGAARADVNGLAKIEAHVLARDLHAGYDGWMEQIDTPSPSSSPIR
jgi:hypothetical protein